MAENMRRDALGREIALCLIHDDGHVGALANQGILVEATVLRLHTLYGWMGVAGWATEYLPVDDALEAFVAGQGCPKCAIAFGCGCSFQRVALHQCPHDTAARFHALAHVVGYCGNDHPQHQGPPLPALARVYRPGAHLGHLAATVDLPGAMSVCGQHPPEDGWLGLAGERQQATVLRLPVCNNCLAAVAHA